MLKKIEKSLLKDDNEYISSVIIEVVKENLDNKLIEQYIFIERKIINEKDNSYFYGFHYDICNNDIMQKR